MEHKLKKISQVPNRVGFHYFPDSIHYTEKDIHRWLPALKKLNTRWLVIQAPRNYSVPEDFVRAISSCGINLILDFNIPLSEEPNWHDLELYLISYSKWGAKYAMLNKHPNLQRSWEKNQWGNPDLINYVVENFIIFGTICLKNNLKPVFPLLTPGGDYWDLSFLKIALLQLKKEAPAILQNNFVLSAAAWQWGHPLDWGAGAQICWPNVMPYKLAMSSENQLGFRTYEWYGLIANEVFGVDIPVLLLEAGVSNDPTGDRTKLAPASQEDLLAIVDLLNGKNVYDASNQTNLLHSVSNEVIGCCFFLLSSESPDFQACQWYSAVGKPLPPAQAIFIRQQNNPYDIQEVNQEEVHEKSFMRNRYIFISDELLNDSPEIIDRLEPYINKYSPLIGNSVDEALQSAVVLFITSDQDKEKAILEAIKGNGCLVKILPPQEILAFVKELTNAR